MTVYIDVYIPLYVLRLTDVTSPRAVNGSSVAWITLVDRSDCGQG